MSVWKMSATIIGVVLVFVLGIVGAEERCNCNYISHPQTDFCQSAYAFHGLITGVVYVPAPGEPDLGEIFNKYVKYNISVVEVFKGRKRYLDAEYVSIYSPKGGICGKTDLYQHGVLGDASNNNQYLITGDISTSDNGEDFLVITNCNWIVSWEDITREQRQGLKGLYSECTCLIYPRAGPLEKVTSNAAEQFNIESCVYNPVGALILSAPDCETDHGICMRAEGSCRWALTPSFEECFDSRNDQLISAASAITSRSDCSFYSGKQKKKCLMKLYKSKANNF